MQDDQSILEEATAILSAEKREAYGNVNESFVRLSKMWSLILDIHVTPEQVCLCMIGLKITREVNCHQRDNLVDLAGYSQLLAFLEGDDSVPLDGRNQ